MRSIIQNVPSYFYLKMIVLLDLLISDNNSKKYTYTEIEIIKMGVDTWKIGTKIRMWDVRSLSTQKLVCAPVCLSTKMNSGLPQLKKKNVSRKRVTGQKWRW